MIPESPLHRYATFIVRRARSVVLLTVAATLFLTAQIPRLRVHFDPESSLPSSHPFVQIDREIRADFGGRRTVIFALVPRTGTVWTAPMLARMHAMTQAALDLDGLIRQNVVSLASPNMRHLEDRDGTLTEDYLMREPPADAAGVAEVRRRYDANPLARGTVVSTDARAALLIADFWDTTDIHRVAEDVAALADRFTDAEASVHIAGEPVAVHEDFLYARHMAPLFGLAFVAIMVVLYLSFRSFQGMLVPMLTALMSVLADLGVMALIGVDIDPWNQAVPILVIAIAAGHSAQMMKRYYEELAVRRDNRAAVIATVERMGTVMMAAGATAALGFAALALFRVPAIRNYGLATAYGIASAVILEMTFIPALRSLLPVRVADAVPVAPHGPVARVLECLADAALGRGRLVIFALAVLVVGAGALGVTHLRPSASLREYMLPGGRARRDLDAIMAHFPGTITMTVLVEGGRGAAQSPQVVHFLDGLAAELRRDPAVAMTSSLADVLRFVRSVFDPESGGALPDDAATIAQLFYLASAPAFERFVDRAFSRTVLWAYLTTDESEAMRALLARTQRYTAAHPPGDAVRVRIAGGTGPSLFALNEHTTRGKLWNIGAILLAVYVISAVILRSPAGGAYVVLPLAATLVVNIGILGWAGFALDLATTTIVAIAVGIGADYSMYLLYRMREEFERTHDLRTALRRTMVTSGRAVVFVAVAIATGFSVMLPAEHLSWRLTGALLPATMLVSCTAALTLVPTLVVLTRPRFIFERRPRRVVAERAAGEGVSA